MLRLITGVPGAGKTLYTLHTLKDVRDRPIFHNGIPDLSPSLPWLLLRDAAQWHDEVPDNAIVVIDEAQRVFPVRAPKVPVPAGVTALETHRHRGIDLYIVTQHPSLIDHHVRRLVGEHYHLRRPFGAPYANLYHANEVMDVADTGAMKRSAQLKRWPYPKSSFGLYKSAEVHTHKFRLPVKILWVFPALLLLGFAVSQVFGLIGGYREQGERSPAVVAPDSSPGVVPDTRLSPVPAGGSPDPMIAKYAAGSPSYMRVDKSAADRFDADREAGEYWRTTYLPTFGRVPPSGVPRLSGCALYGDSCRCFTDQGATIQSVPDDFCRTVVRDGFHDGGSHQPPPVAGR